MKSFVVFALLSLLFITIRADTSACQSTTERVKAAARTANAWRAACEDAQWKGASCYNYWAQLDELTTLQTNLQTCLVAYDKTWAGETLGVGSKPGIFSADGTNSRSVESTNTDATKTIAANQETQTRALIKTQTDSEINKTQTVVSAESTATRSTVQTEFKAVRDLENAAQDKLRSNVNDRTVAILNTVQSQADQTRNAVVANHTFTRNDITTKAQADGASSRTTESTESSNTRTHDSDESAYTRGYVSNEASISRQRVSNEHAATRTSVSNNAKQVRADVADAGKGLRTRIGEVKANLTAERTNSGRGDRNLIKSEQSANSAAVAQQAQNSRAMFSALQAAIQLQYAQNQGASDNMWSQINNLMLHLDLQGSCISTNPVERRDVFGDTDTFQNPASKGGRFDALRAAAYDTLTYNEQTYGSNKVGIARSYWNSGEAYRANGDLRMAADRYRAMYVLAVLSW